MADTHNEKPESIRSYVVVWAVLLALTALSVTVATLYRGKVTALVCLCIAAIESALMFLVFMHLRRESNMVIKLIIPITVALLAIFIGITFTDVLAR